MCVNQKAYVFVPGFHRNRQSSTAVLLGSTKHRSIIDPTPNYSILYPENEFVLTQQESVKRMIQYVVF